MTTTSACRFGRHGMAGARRRPGLAAALAGAMLAALPVRAAAAPLDFETFFSGHLVGVGAVDNKREGTRRPFTASIDAHWEGPRGSVVEDLSYVDGETKRLAWTFERRDATHWTGRRADIVGEADVRREGDVLRMTYRARTRVPSGSTWTLSFDDRFTRTGPRTVQLAGAVSYLFLDVGATAMTITRDGP